METIITGVITGILTLAGVLVTNNKTQAVMETKVDELTREVREHNNFAKRVPVLEAQMEAVDRRLEKMEANVK